jgi:hypothetical protein
MFYSLLPFLKPVPSLFVPACLTQKRAFGSRLPKPLSKSLMLTGCPAFRIAHREKIIRKCCTLPRIAVPFPQPGCIFSSSPSHFQARDKPTAAGKRTATRCSHSINCSWEPTLLPGQMRQAKSNRYHQTTTLSYPTSPSPGGIPSAPHFPISEGTCRSPQFTSHHITRT